MEAPPLRPTSQQLVDFLCYSLAPSLHQSTGDFFNSLQQRCCLPPWRLFCNITRYMFSLRVMVMACTLIINFQWSSPYAVTMQRAVRPIFLGSSECLRDPFLGTVVRLGAPIFRHGGEMPSPLGFPAQQRDAVPSICGCGSGRPCPSFLWAWHVGQQLACSCTVLHLIHSSHFLDCLLESSSPWQTTHSVSLRIYPAASFQSSCLLGFTLELSSPQWTTVM